MVKIANFGAEFKIIHAKMIETSVNLPIGPDSENRWLASWGEEPAFFSLETIKKLFNDHPEEKDFKFNFNCDGGYVEEGLAIYDTMRTSGKNIYCNIEGGCHSMAIVMLLAAPKENRTANPNCRALIHNVRTMPYGDMTAGQMEDAAEELRMQEGAILDIYADRTGMNRDVLQSIMNEEKVRTASELLEWGFIGSVNNYNTNSKPQGMHKSTPNINSKNQSSMANKTKQQVLNEANSFLSKLKNLLGGAAVNYDHADADGNVLFTTDAENDHLEVGMVASPDGTYTLAVATSEFPEGTVVIIADGVITEINEPQGGEDNDDLDAANARIAELEAALNEAQETITGLMAQVSSNYNPKNAKPSFAPASKPQEVDSKDELRKRYGLKAKEE